MPRSKALLVMAVLTFSLTGQATQALAAADPCQSAIVKALAKYKKTFLKAHTKCLNNENKNSIAGDACPDATTNLAITKATDKAKAKIAAQCTSVSPQITGLGYRSDCAYEDATGGIEATCEGLPVGTVDEFTTCMQCWKGAELAEFLAIIYASHAMDVCEGDLGETSTVCSDLDCTTPLPDQKDLGDNSENDCQVGISKAATKYLLKREKILETCMLKGCPAAQCLAGTCTLYPTSAVLIQKAETAKDSLIQKKCGGNRTPAPTTPDNFCCKCGGNNCMNIPDRPTCAATSGCMVQEGKFCDIDLTCSPAPKTLTWWDNCPESDTCPGTAVTTMAQLTTCVDAAADAISDELLCFQFPGYPCPAPDSTTTTTAP